MILHEVKGAGECRCTESNRQLVVVVWSCDLATQSGGAATDSRDMEANQAL